jgi:hypothetical protein
LTAAATLTGLTIAAESERWNEAGFHVEDGRCGVGAVVLRFVETDGRSGIRGWSLSGLPEGDLDGLVIDPASPRLETAGAHPNGALQIDHVVAFTPDLERTTGAFESAGIRRRRVREVGEGEGLARQGFFRAGEAIVEIVETPQLRQDDPDAPAVFWGVTFTVRDLDACAELLGERLGVIRDAIQPGRQIATVSREAGLGLPVALMTPNPPPT